MRRVCDACSIRRVKCDGEDPCSRCLNSSLECHRLRPRQKMGPKSIRKKTFDRLVATTETHQSYQGDQLESGRVNHLATNSFPADQDAGHSYGIGQISTATLTLYLDIYNHKMFPVWPIVDTNALILRLNDFQPDFEAYMLAASICAATILQLQLAMDGGETPVAQAMIDEIEHLRYTRRYRQYPSLDSLRTSFFMHVAYIHIGQRMTSTLLLKEAISTAHLLNLHNASFYANLPRDEEQVSLRVIWLLFITDRAHASQYDIPSTVSIPASLPSLASNNQEFSLDAFTLLCSMFAHFSQAFDNANPTTVSLTALDTDLRALPMLSRQHNTIQRADALVTKQWMRLSLWKLAVSQMQMSTSPSESLDSIFFPIQATRDLLSTISQLSIDALEAHGPGMELKLFEFANSLADVITCLPTHSVTSVPEFGPKDSLVHLATLLGSFRGGSNALMPILQARLGGVGLDVPRIPRVVDVSGESNESDGTRSSHELEEVGRDQTISPFRQSSPAGSFWPLDFGDSTLLTPPSMTTYVAEPG